MGVGAGLYMYGVVVKSSLSLSHLLMSSCKISQRLAKLHARKLIVSCAVCVPAGHCPAQTLRTRQTS